MRALVIGQVLEGLRKGHLLDIGKHFLTFRASLHPWHYIHRIYFCSYMILDVDLETRVIKLYHSHFYLLFISFESISSLNHYFANVQLQ